MQGQQNVKTYWFSKATMVAGTYISGTLYCYTACLVATIVMYMEMVRNAQNINQLLRFLAYKK